ncbi:hypothetical protein C4K46_01745 [Streptococcus oricebi]|uniref:Uncharacterized protein n=2 Tax=Streptococcus oricebi TaxID=1547447 RepID=A0ABS5B1G8_9STRE|nr:hypothetical protein [Streptococcus oricebi]
MIFQYKKKLADNTFLFITYSYKNSKITENIELSNGDLSTAFAQERIQESKKDKESELTLKEIYQFYNLDYPKQQNISSSNKVLDYLKTYNIDKAWLEKKSHEILYDDVLKVWFEKGSQRYSFKNLGDLKIERAEMFTSE